MLVLLSLMVAPPGLADSRVATTPAAWDDIGAIIDRMELPGVTREEISDSQLSDLNVLRRYDAVFLNCSWLASSYAQQSAAALRQYVQEGGYVYASDYAFTYLDEAFPGWIYFYSDPRIGKAGTVDARVVDAGLESYLGQSRVSVRYNLGSWVPVRFTPLALRYLVGDITIDLAAGVLPPLAPPKSGHGHGPTSASESYFAWETVSDSILALAFNYGRGKVVYTTFHNEAQLDELSERVLRYFVFDATGTLRASLTTDRTFVYPGDRSSVRVRLANETGGSVDHPTISLPVPDGMSYIDQSGVPRPVQTGSSIVWQIASLSSGDSASVTAEFTPTVSSGLATFVGNVTATGVESFETNEIALPILALPPNPVETAVTWNYGAALFAKALGESGTEVAGFGLSGVELSAGLKAGQYAEFELQDVGGEVQLRVRDVSRQAGLFGFEAGSVKALVGVTAASGDLEVGTAYATEMEVRRPLNRDEDTLLGTLILLSEGVKAASVLNPGTGIFTRAVAEALEEAFLAENVTRTGGEAYGSYEQSHGTASVHAGPLSMDLTSVGAIAGGGRFFWDRAESDGRERAGYEVSLAGSVMLPMSLFVGPVISAEGGAGVTVERDAAGTLGAVEAISSLDRSIGVPLMEWHDISVHVTRFEANQCTLLESDHSTLLMASLCSLESGVATTIAGADGFVQDVLEPAVRAAHVAGPLAYSDTSEQHVLLSMEPTLDLSAALGAGGGISIGWELQAGLGRRFLTRTADVVVRGGVIDLDNEVQYSVKPSRWEGADGVVEFHRRLFARSSDIVDRRLQSLIASVREEVQLTAAEIRTQLSSALANLVLDGQRWMDNWAGSLFATSVSWDTGLVTVERLRAAGEGERTGVEYGWRPYRSQYSGAGERGASVDVLTILGDVQRVAIENADGVAALQYPAGSTRIEMVVSDAMLDRAGYDSGEGGKLAVFRYLRDDARWQGIPSTSVRSETSWIVSAPVDGPGDFGVGLSSPSVDRRDPTIEVREPSKGPTIRVSGARVTIGGVAADNQGVRRVEWMADDGRRGACLGVDSWTTTIDLLQSSTVLAFRAIDMSGNVAEETVTVLRGGPPEANAGSDQRLQCSSPEGASVRLDGSGSRDPDSTPGTNDDIVSFVWSEQGGDIGSGVRPEVVMRLGEHDVLLTVSDRGGEQDQDEVQVSIQDTAAPEGGIVRPSWNQCFGVSAGPVVIEDDFTDACDQDVERSYAPAGPYVAHGNHVVQITGRDDSGNARTVTAGFTIDAVPPQVVLRDLGENWVFPTGVPFGELFVAGDDDAAAGGVVREEVWLDDCMVYDGATYGNRDGRLSDEVIPAGNEELCRIAAVCGRRIWRDPVVRVRASDCGGNTTIGQLTAKGGYSVPPAACP